MKASSFTIKKVLKKLYPFLILFCLKFSPVQAQCTEAELATSYVSNNSNKGIMFDIVTGANPVTITGFDFNLILGSTGQYEIYYKSGTFLGSENNASLWTYAGVSPMVTSLGYDYPTPIPLALNITIPANSTYGFYFTNNDDPTTNIGIRYTNNSSNTTLVASDANISIISGRGMAYPFGQTYDNRSVNCTPHYYIGSPPAAPTSVSVSETSVCSGADVSLSANCASGTVKWYNQASGGTSIGTGTGLIQNPTSNTTYYAVCDAGLCESSRVATNQVTVSAATLIVSNLNDEGAGSFRQAILDANASACTSIIDATGVTGTINLLSRLPDINANTTINGPTAGNLIISRNSSDSFRILSIGAGRTVTINDLILTNGSDSQGGGISNAGNLTLNRLIITGNTASYGSGIQNDNVLVMNSCLLVNNSASNFESYGTTNIFNNCTISDYVSLSGADVTLTLKIHIYKISLMNVNSIRHQVIISLKTHPRHYHHLLEAL